MDLYAVSTVSGMAVGFLLGYGASNLFWEVGKSWKELYNDKARELDYTRTYLDRHTIINKAYIEFSQEVYKACFEEEDSMSFHDFVIEKANVIDLALHKAEKEATHYYEKKLVETQRKRLGITENEGK